MTSSDLCDGSGGVGSSGSCSFDCCSRVSSCAETQKQSDREAGKKEDHLQRRTLAILALPTFVFFKQPSVETSMTAALRVAAQRLARPQVASSIPRFTPAHRVVAIAPKLASRSFSVSPSVPFRSSPIASSLFSSSDDKVAVPSTTQGPAPEVVKAADAPATGGADAAATAVPDAITPLVSDGGAASSAIVEQTAKTFSEVNLSSWPNVRAVEMVLDTINETTGLPWWAVIISFSAALRLLLFPTVAKGQAHSQRMANVQPQMQALMKDVTEAQRMGDPMAQQQATAKVQKFMKDKNVHPLTALKLPAIQMPIFVSIFFALKGLASENLVTMKNGGLFWFPDLTMADGTWALPIISAACTLAVMETGAELGASSAPNQQQKVMRWVLRGSVCSMPFFVSAFPTACFVYWISASGLSLMQMLVLRIPAVKKYFNVPDRIDHSANATTTSKQGGEMSFAEAVAAGYSSQRPLDSFNTPAPAASTFSAPVTPQSTKQDQAFNKWFKQPGQTTAEVPSSTAETKPAEGGLFESSVAEDNKGVPSSDEASLAAMQREAKRQQDEAEAKRQRIAAARSKRNQRKRF